MMYALWVFLCWLLDPELRNGDENAVIDNDVLERSVKI